MNIVIPDKKTGYNDIYIINDLMETDLHRVIYSRQVIALYGNSGISRGGGRASCPDPELTPPPFPALGTHVLIYSLLIRVHSRI